MPEVKALPIKNIPSAVPRIDPNRFTATQFEQVLRDNTTATIYFSEATSWAVPGFVWLDVACIDQRPNSPLKAQEIGRQTVIFRGAEEVFVWLHACGIEPAVLRQALNDLSRADGETLYPWSLGCNGLEREGEVLRGDEAFLSTAVASRTTYESQKAYGDHQVQVLPRGQFTNETRDQGDFYRTKGENLHCSDKWNVDNLLAKADTVGPDISHGRGSWRRLGIMIWDLANNSLSGRTDEVLLGKGQAWARWEACLDNQ